MAFDKVKPADHDKLGLVPEELKSTLKTRSAKRIKESNDFTKLVKAIESVKERKARKSIPLNEKELREQIAREGTDKLEKMADDLSPAESYDKAKYKFARNFLNNEILRIMEDFVQGKKLVKE